MLSPVTRTVADRLIGALMTLVRAIAPCVFADVEAAPAQAAAESIFFRLSNLVLDLIHISRFGVRARPAPTPPRSTECRRPARPHFAPSFVRRPGWLLDVLPEIAPSVDDLRALLGDPAVAALLESDPALQRALRPILRGLGLTAPPPTPSPPPPSHPGSDLTIPPTLTQPSRPQPPQPPRRNTQIAQHSSTPNWLR